jgi:hypothetical protein
MSDDYGSDKALSTGMKAAIGLGAVLMALACGGGGEKSTSAAPAAGEPAAASGAAAPAAPAAPAEPEWVAARKAACAKYEEAPNEIKKSAVFSEYVDGAKAKQASIENIRATLSELETPQGGGSVRLKFSTPFGEFTNNGIFTGDKVDRDVSKGSPLYNAAGELAEKAEVTLSASNIIPAVNPISERAGVCGDAWVVKYTKIEAVK